MSPAKNRIVRLFLLCLSISLYNYSSIWLLVAFLLCLERKREPFLLLSLSPSIPFVHLGSLSSIYFSHFGVVRCLPFFSLFCFLILVSLVLPLAAPLLPPLCPNREFPSPYGFNPAASSPSFLNHFCLDPFPRSRLWQ